MSYRKEDISALKKFIPDNCFDTVFHYLNRYNISLTITKERKRLLGTYTYNTTLGTNEITINGNLNPYNFLITLLHEIAHCITFNVYKNRVKPHGNEWKDNYSNLLHDFILLHIFPEDIVKALHKQIQNPSASCSDAHLEKVLHQYDKNLTDKIFVSDIPLGQEFTFNNKQFRVLEKRRTRYLCLDTERNTKYLFSGVSLVTPIN